MLRNEAGGSADPWPGAVAAGPGERRGDAEASRPRQRTAPADRTARAVPGRRRSARRAGGGLAPAQGPELSQAAGAGTWPPPPPRATGGGALAGVPPGGGREQP